MRFFRKSARAPAVPSSAPDEVELRGNGQFQLEIKGESHYQDNIQRAANKHGYSSLPAMLILEDENPYDRNAVRVEIDGLKVGYLSREVAPLYRKQLQLKGHPRAIGTCDARIYGGSGDRPTFGIWLDIPVESDD